MEERKERPEPAPPVLVVGDRSLVEVLRWARAALAAGDPAAGPEGAVALELIVADPDAGWGCWPGQPRDDGVPQRGWRAWVDLAAALGCALGTPRLEVDGRVRVPLRRLGPEAACG